MTRKALLVCGILSSLVYLCYDIAALRWHGYSYASQTISELFAIGAPSRPAVYPLGLAYDFLLLAFGAGVWRSAGRASKLRIVAGFLVVIGLLGFAWPPMHMRGTVFTLTDSMHIAFAALTSLLILLAVGFGAGAFGKRFQTYSVATLIVMIVFGSLTGTQGARIAANLPTPWVGLTERVDVGAYLVWIVVLAVVLLGRGDVPTRVSRT